ncbi:uncharacterized protein [Cherax quadricarinatus]|uniref:uncharacterized protein n=1 Tax=Cherax quadricarinatus TaxID=27406 RepID=UPI0023780D6A|nr:uncharacterized protein LOC128695416 isoform X1 [Cherax quadricarinatus]
MKVLIAVAALLAICLVVDSAEHDLFAETSLPSHHHGIFRGDHHHPSKRGAEARVVTNPEYYSGGYDGLPKYRYYGIHYPGFRGKRSAESDPGHHRCGDFPSHFGFHGKRSAEANPGPAAEPLADPEANPSHFYGSRGLYRHSGVKHGVYTHYGNFN